jgi:uncharacterized protein (DUF433 family)
MRWQDHITSDATVAAGKPVVRGTRLTVEFLLRLLASEWTREQILREYPHLTSDGLDAALLFAAEAVEHESLFPAA